ncbi:uncharacterized protein LOC123298142 [Chrysoperla carnea]|uniref:uncharacterized protein LOC123298142 n=1 Tax=Chrysoperla carnea TaxID=189513 RepID=UPI001D064E0F|nr:uncharacterized protein LOC123298142 [Chrysoperla carnea]
MNFTSQVTDARNIEMKATLDNVAEKLEIIKGLADTEGKIIKQFDTFYNVQEGRLKLRKFEDKTDEPIAELIFYVRPNATGAKLCNYKKMDVDSKTYDSLNGILSASLGVQGTVSKKRLLFLIGQTRVHVDEVDGLGSFIELETVLDATQSIEEGHQILKELMSKLKIDTKKCLEVSYNDMLISAASSNKTLDKSVPQFVKNTMV